MFYFLYKSGRHDENSRWRFKQTTSRGDFNREMLHRCIRGKYEVINYMDHPAQKLLERIHMQNSFYGHILKIEDPKSAVWIKLNHEQVGKNGTSLVGAWRDIDEDQLAILVDKVEVANKKIQDYYNQKSTLSYNTRYVESMISALTKHRQNDLTGYADEMNTAAKMMDSLKHELQTLNTMWVKHGQVIQDEVSIAQAEVQKYLDEKKY